MKLFPKKSCDGIYNINGQPKWPGIDINEYHFIRHYQAHQIFGDFTSNAAKLAKSD